MPYQNRVKPDGEIVADAARGTMYGNRGGCFHRDDQTLKARRWATKQWLCCVLAFKGRRRKLLQPGRFTELFFLDEAVAMAAGHRPCFECRRADAETFRGYWVEARGNLAVPRAPVMDDVLQAERIDPRGAKVTVRRPLDELADGVFVRIGGEALLVHGDRLLPFGMSGYGRARARPVHQTVEMLTPPTIAAIFAAGYVPRLHASAQVQ